MSGIKDELVRMKARILDCQPLWLHGYMGNYALVPEEAEARFGDVVDWLLMRAPALDVYGQVRQLDCTSYTCVIGGYGSAHVETLSDNGKDLVAIGWMDDEEDE